MSGFQGKKKSPSAPSANRLTGTKRGHLPKVDSKCLTCGKEFKVKMSAYERGHGLFCSLNCRGLYDKACDGYKRKDNGYVMVKMTNHHRAQRNFVREHILIIEKVIGKRIPVKSVVHHVDGNGLNNQNDNLVLCQNKSYHNFLHRRLDALRASENKNYRKCIYCRSYDDLNNLKNYPNKKGYPNYFHIQCARDYSNMARKRRISRSKGGGEA